MVEIIKSQEHKSLGSTLWIDGDDGGKWIHTSLMNGTLVLAGHDGSYQEALAINICAGAAELYCTCTKQYAKLTWVEKRNKKTATNYREEILGAIAVQLLIKFSVDEQDVVGHK
jgi:hypothetical protein